MQPSYPKELNSMLSIRGDAEREAIGIAWDEFQKTLGIIPEKSRPPDQTEAFKKKRKKQKLVKKSKQRNRK